MNLSTLDQKKLSDWRATELACKLRRKRTPQQLKRTYDAAQKQRGHSATRTPCPC